MYATQYYVLYSLPPDQDPLWSVILWKSSCLSKTSTLEYWKTFKRSTSKHFYNSVRFVEIVGTQLLHHPSLRRYQMKMENVVILFLAVNIQENFCRKNVSYLYPWEVKSKNSDCLKSFMTNILFCAGKISLYESVELLLAFYVIVKKDLFLYDNRQQVRAKFHPTHLSLLTQRDIPRNYQNETSTQKLLPCSMRKY